MFSISGKNLVKSVSILALVILVLNCFTIVDATQAKVQNCFGKVNEEHIFLEGTHLVNPFCSFDTFIIAEQKYEVEKLSIPTQDRFNSSANVTVLFKIPAAKVIDIRKQFGSQSTFIETSLRQHLRSIIRDEGRKMIDSRSLGQSTDVSNMQMNSTNRLGNIMFANGMDVGSVLVQDIEFDPRIAAQILDAQIRIQNEESQASQTRVASELAEQVIQKQRGISTSNEMIADAAAYATRTATDASVYETRQKADAKRYAIEQVAEGNLKLSPSLTTAVLNKQRLDNDALLFSRSKGNVPATVIGDTDLRAYGVPMPAVR